MANALPSRASQRLRTNLQALIDEFSRRPMDAPAVAAFLNCSASSSYMYVYMLFDHAVIGFDGAALEAGGTWRKAYRLNPDAGRVERFLAQLDQFKLPRGASAHTRPVRPARPAASQKDSGRDGAPATREPARRDPLVAALFGASLAAPSLAYRAAPD